MSFLSPIFLASLPLIAVPLIIHLLSRRQQRKISWGAMRFLVQAATRRRRWWRLTDLLLLLLRTAAFLFFIMALARPLLPTTWLGGAVPREVVLVLDQSLSMSRRVGAESLFDQQLNAANRLLDGLHPGDGIRVLLAGERPDWLTTDLLAATESTVADLRTRLAQLKPTQGGADITAAIGEALDLEVPADKSARVIAVITDGRRYGWRLNEEPLWKALQTRVAHAAIPSTINLQVLPDPSALKSNLAIEKIDSARSVVALNQPLTFTAFVQNHGPEASSPTLLSWRIGDRSLDVATIPALPPGSGTTVSLNHSFGEAGIHGISCNLDTSDDLDPDNEAHYLVEVKERIPVLVIEDTPHADPLESDTGFFLAALGIGTGESASTGWHSIFEPTVMDSTALGSTDLARYRAIVMADIPRLSPAVVDKLTKYVEAGGGLWITLGPQTDPKFFNEALFRQGIGLAPAQLRSPIGDADDREKFFSVRATSDAHPATALLSDVQRLDLDRARIFRRHQFDTATGKDVSTLLQIEDGSAIVMERRMGRGRIIVQAVPLGAAWSNLPLCQAYVAMLHEWLWYLSEPTLPKRNIVVGESLWENARSETNAVTAELTLPDGQKLGLTPVMTPAGPVFRHDATRWPGEYILEFRTNNTLATRVQFRVRRNVEESNLAPLSDEEWAMVKRTQGLQMGATLPSLSISDQIRTPRRPLDGWLLTALACVLLGEIALAGWTMHRRNLHVDKIAMEA